MDFSRWKKATLLYSCYADVRPYRFPIFPTVFPGRSIERNLELIFGVCSYTCVCCVCVHSISTARKRRLHVKLFFHQSIMLPLLPSFSRFLDARAYIFLAGYCSIFVVLRVLLLAVEYVCFSRIYFANVWIKSMAILSELPLTSVGSF